MDIKSYYDPSLSELDKIVSRKLQDDSSIKDSVVEILNKVKEEGDDALYYYSEKFDSVKLDSLIVSEREFEEAEGLVSDDMKKSLEIASKNIRAFHEAQLPEGECVEVMDGIKLERKIVPITTVGLYVPGGTAPLFSTVLMLSIPAKVAGCKNIVLSTPPMKNGKVNPIVLYAAKLSGVSDVYKIGGAGAIAAMAYGTDSVSKVDKIFGPGNRYVSTAKMMVSSFVSIDMLAGPSEVMVVANSKSNPNFVASDFLSQAEHGKDSQSVLTIIADEEEGELYKEKFLEALDSQLKILPRHEYLLPSLKNSKIIIEPTVEKAQIAVNIYAPEHLVVNIDDARSFIDGISNAGSIFLGPYACESAGDYASGTNHTLPTSGWAVSQSGVSTDSFIKKITVQTISKAGLTELGKTIITMAEGEGLQAHANAVKVRMK
ncbi:MAG: histidinol dehydrogenase [Sphaerochaetaceae bacterium]|nr:histidinol dehydrogenase [Sphaerochaetaceae bacterium]